MDDRSPLRAQRAALWPALADALAQGLPAFAWFEGAQARLVVGASTDLHVHVRTFTGTPGQGPWAGWPVRPEAGPAPVVEDAATWQARVAAAEAACQRGVMEKVVPARVVRHEAPPGLRYDPLATLEALLAGAGDGVVFLLAEPGRWFLGASPEILVRVTGGHLSTHALAGTRRRPAEAGQLVAAEQALLDSGKDRREHAAVVDDLREQLAGVCTHIEVGARPHVRRLPTLLHLETPVQGTLRPGISVLDVVDRLHPTAALGGRPRAAALAWLAATEPFDRGGFGAPIGYTTSENDGVFCVAIRSVLMTPTWALAFAGAGVVAGTDPAAEWAETEAKLQTATSALRMVPA